MEWLEFLSVLQDNDMPHSLRPALAILFVGMLAMPVVAQEAPPACASVASPSERLACYDRAFPPPAIVREETARQAIVDFGLERDQGPLRNPGQPIEEVDPDSVEGTVAKVEYHGGKRAITLEGGQKWMSLEGSSSGHLRAGETVILRKGMMGNFLLTTRGGATLRVRRVR